MTGPCEVQHDVHVNGRPREAWLRVTATASYLLTVNDIVLDEQDTQLGTLHPAIPMQRTYDLMPVVRRGHNSVSLRLTGTPGPPHLLADLEMQDDAGRCYRLGTDETWLARGEANGPGGMEAARDGRPCHIDPGDLDIPPSDVPGSIVPLTLPLDVLLKRASGEAALMAVIALLTVIACRRAAQFLASGSGMPAPLPSGVVYLALVPATLAISAGILACYDPRIACQDVYQEQWLYAAVLSVPLQWLLLAGIGRLWQTGRRAEVRRLVPGLAGCLVVVLIGGGLALRLHDLTAEPLHPDEVTILRISRFLIRRGFPNLEVHQDLPPIYISGCELESISVALASFFFDDDLYTVRIPAVIYGVLMIPLIYRLGRSLFGTAAGLTASAFYALAPACLLMTHFGRYPSLLQLTTLLTVYYFWRTIAGAGPLRQRALWLTVLSFLAMFLSWEASILLAPGMVLAALFYRRGRLRTLFCNPSVYAGAIVVLSIVLLQMAHGALQQTQFLWYGTGFSDVKLDLMWRYPFFDPLYYIRAASWSEDFLLPMLGLAGAGILAIRHRLQRRVRVLLLIFLTPCLLMSGLLTVFAARYSYHLIPLFILLASAALTAGARGMVRVARAGPAPSYHGYARAIGLLMVFVGIGLGSGMTVQLTELKSFLGSGARPGELRVPNFAGAVEHLRRFFQEGDVVVAAQPEVIDYLIASDGRGFPASWSADYWLQSTMLLQAVLDDRRPLPLHRFSGTAMISSCKSLESVFARHRRIWYITAPPFDDKSNNADTAQFVREHMDIVYQDYSSMILLRDNQHRPAWKRLEGENALQKAKAHYLH
jgi:hypothetical protein